MSKKNNRRNTNNIPQIKTEAEKIVNLLAKKLHPHKHLWICNPMMSQNFVLLL